LRAADTPTVCAGDFGLALCLRSGQDRRDHSRCDTIMSDPQQLSDAAQKIATRIAVYLGPHTARAAVKTYVQKALGRGADTLRAEDVPAVIVALRPMLKTFLGRERCETVLKLIEKEAGR
jgi:hypothetical protein